MPYVDSNGELAECPSCEALRIELDDARRVLLGRNIELATLKSEKDRERDEHPKRPTVIDLFKYWRTACGRPRTKLDAKRFDAILWGLTLYGEAECRMAIYGASVSAYQERGKRYDAITLIFRTADKFERFRDDGERHLKRTDAEAFARYEAARDAP